MRQITALMPTTKTLLEIFNLWRRRPAALSLDQIAHAGRVRRSGATRVGRLAHTNIEPETLGRSKTGARLERGCVPRSGISRCSFAIAARWKKSGVSCCLGIAAAGPLDPAALRPPPDRDCARSAISGSGISSMVTLGRCCGWSSTQPRSAVLANSRLRAKLRAFSHEFLRLRLHAALEGFVFAHALFGGVWAEVFGDSHGASAFAEASSRKASAVEFMSWRRFVRLSRQIRGLFVPGPPESPVLPQLRVQRRTSSHPQ
jgi:hypothetical protein